MKLIRIVTLSVLLSFCYGDNLFAELTRSDIKEEIQHVDKRIDDLKTEVQGIRSEITGIRTEIKVESKDIKSEINAVQSDLQGLIKDVRSDLQSFLLWGFGIVFAGIFALIGFALWDRRTALAPAIRKN